MKEEDSEEDDSLKVVSFEKTPIMSTYLVAFVIGDFDYIEGKSSDGIRLRVFTPLGKTEQGKFALEVSSLYSSPSEIFFYITCSCQM